MDNIARLRWVGIRAAAVVTVVINATSTADSFMGLRSWALGHNMIGFGSYLFPCFIDSFPTLAEIALFIGLIDRWTWKVKSIPWVVIALGLVVSVGFQVGNIRTTDVWTKVTHGMPPVAACLSLIVGTLIFELIMHNKPKLAERPELEDETDDGLDLDRAIEIFADDLKAGKVPGRNRIRESLAPCGHDKAKLYQERLRDIAGAA